MDDLNVRSDSYWIAHTVGECSRCCAATRIVALALPPGHESLTLEWATDRHECVGYVWESVASRAFLFYVEHLSESVQRRLREFSRSYRRARGTDTFGPYWANHCEHCGTVMDDHHLFCEPGGAFLPATPENARAVKLARIAESLEAGAVGYACEPHFFESMIAT